MDTTIRNDFNTSLSSDNLSYYEDSDDHGFGNPFDIPYTRVFFITCYAFVFAMCILGNSMVLFAIARSPRLRSMTNFFLANLAIADFCVGAFCVLPNVSTFLSPNWILGKAMCKIYYYIVNVSYTASIIILTVIAIERYIAIIHPFKARNLLTPKRLKITQAIIWFIALVYNIPYLIFYDTFTFVDFGKEYCYSSHAYHYDLKMLSLANFIMWYIIPLTLIGFMYYRVAFALWKTTVVSGMSLHCNDGVDRGSIRSNNQTKIFEMNTDSRVHTCRSSSMDEEDTLDKRDRYSSESRSSEKSPMYQEKQTTLIVCSDNNKCGGVPPNVVRNASPPSSTCNGDEDGIPLHDISPNATENSVKHRFKHRNPGNSNLRRTCRARKKVIKLLVSVVITFGVCVLPHMMKVLNHYWSIIEVPHSINLYLSPMSFIVLFLNSGLNPILYALFSNNFRRSFKESFRCVR